MALPNLLAGTCGKGEASNLFKSGIFTDFCVWLRFVFCEHYLEYLVHQPHEDRVSIGVFSLAINFELLPDVASFPFHTEISVCTRGLLHGLYFCLER